jgi:hypothetical protein
MKTEPFFVKGMGHNGFDYHIEVMLMTKISGFLDYYVLARRLWMKPAVKKPPKNSNTTKRRRAAAQKVS